LQVATVVGKERRDIKRGVIIIDGACGIVYFGVSSTLNFSCPARCETDFWLQECGKIVRGFGVEYPDTAKGGVGVC
jgi:hypothetical protein